jgi:hypothetical protein
MPKSVTDKSDFQSRGILHETSPTFGGGDRPDPAFSDSFAIHSNLRSGSFRRSRASDESCVSDANCSTERKLVAYVTEAPAEKNAPTMPGDSLTPVVVTQCNPIVGVNMTMPDGKLPRFDQSASVPAEQLLTMAFTARRSERVGVSCNDLGSVGHDHGPL